MTTTTEDRDSHRADADSHAIRSARQNLMVAGGVAGLMALSVLVAFFLVR